jgi:hypothetical protein
MMPGNCGQKSMLSVTPFQSRLARAALNWSFDDLQRYSGYDRMKLCRFEGGRAVTGASVLAGRLRQLFEQAGIAFREDGISYPRQWTYET